MVNSSLTTSQNGVPGSSATNLVFIDTAVTNVSSLLAGLSPNTEAIVLDPTKDGISQITNFLSQRSGIIDSIQILGHGAAGMLQLGATSLSAENLDEYKSALETWFTPQADKKPDLLIYGCDVASGEVGDKFIQKLSQITGADVAASVDLTGSAAKGGNWILEKATGIIEAGQAFSQQVRDAYQDVLATFTVKNNNDDGIGSLRWAIEQANLDTTLDNIIFDIGSGGVQTISLLTPLPVINTPINLDATTQPGGASPPGGWSNFPKQPMIELRGDKIPAFTMSNPGLANVTNGLTFWNGSNGSTAKGFIINRFQGNGIKVGAGNNYNDNPTVPGRGAGPVNGPSGVTIENNYIGTDISGTVGLGNSWWGDPEVVNGLYVHRSPNTVISNNLISGNTTTALVIREFSTNLQIVNNRFGTDVTGSLPLGTQRWSVYINHGSNGLFQGNLVAASGYDYENDGMEMFETYGTNMNITGNTFGTDITRTKSFRNRGHYQAGELYPGGVPIVVRLYGSDTVSNNFYLGAWPFRNNGNTAINLPLPPQPILNPIAPNLGAIANNINPNSNQGRLISSLVRDSITNPDGSPDQGIAITNVDNSNGTWEYSTNNGGEWQDLATALVSKYRPQSNANYPGGFSPAFLLSNDNKNRIRFVPNPGFVGLVNDGVIYQGWNQRTGGNGIVLNISPFGRPNVSPLLNSLSTAKDSLSIEVTGTNQAPVLKPDLVKGLDDIPLNPETNPGTLVTTILENAVTDPDFGALKGIAITNVDNSRGTWEYALDGTTWLPIGNPSITTARLLAADGDTKIRFVPNDNFAGIVPISFRAWDRSSGGAEGNTANTTNNGESTAFSTSVATSKIAVGNQAPAIALDAPFNIPLEVLRLLKNPPAAPAPKTVVAGETPVSAFDNEEHKSEFDRLPDTISAFDRLPDPISIFENEPPKIVPESRWARLPNDIDYISIFMNDPRNAEAKSKWSEQPDQASAMSRYQPNPVTNTIRGTKDEDTLAGTDTANTIFGLQGNDEIVGTPQPDNLIGGKGNDIIRGLGRRDFIRGGAGNDTIYGGRGGDVLFGEKGNDTIYGEKGNDFIAGGNGQDTIYGGQGNDLISGGKGHDRLFGGKGNDVIYGDNGYDLIQGGQGNDVLTGGKGKDIFQFAPGTGTDTITDFTVGEDVIELTKGLTFSDLQITQGVGATVIGLQPGTLFPSDKPLVLIIGVNAASLTPNSFSVV